MRNTPCGHSETKDGCRLCYLYETCPRHRQMWGGTVEGVAVACAADGIGDGLLGLVATTGLLRQHDTPVHYALLGTAGKGADWEVPWVRLFQGYSSLGTSVPEGMLTYHPHDTYAAQNATRLAKPRWQHYCDACSTTAALPRPRRLPPEAVEFARTYRDAVVLAPFSLTSSRCWDKSHFLALERLIVESGRKCVILDGRTEDRVRTHAFRSVVLRDESPERVAAVMASASAVVGLDSSQSHLAGLLSVPCIALCAQIRGEAIFSCYPSVSVINGPAPCSGCHWQGKHGWHPVCDTLCASLQLIRPESVYMRLEHIARPLAGLLPDPVADRHIVGLIDRLAAPYPDRRATMTAFLRSIPHGGSVAETGCQRGWDDYGAGMSTTILGRFLDGIGGTLTTVDIDPNNTATATRATRGLPVSVVVGDSVQWLRDRAAELDAHPELWLSGIYLDAQDTWVSGFAEHCLAEAQAACKLTDNILIDDTYSVGPSRWDGKGSLAIPWLVANGWKISVQGYQTLLTRGEVEASSAAARPAKGCGGCGRPRGSLS